MHPILWSWGPVTLYSYGLLVAVGMFVATHLAARRAPRIGATAGQVLDLSVWIILGALVGARVVYVVQHWSWYAASWVEIVRLDHGGLVFYGGLFGGALAAWIAGRRLGLPLWATLDLLLPAVALAQGIGRIGCFLNGCCYGKPATGPWGVRFPGESFARHPTQLYESVALLLLAGFLLRRPSAQRGPRSSTGKAGTPDDQRRWPMPPGVVTGWYLVGYGAWRFLVEYLRGDNPLALIGLTFSQIASLPLMAVGVWLLSRMLNKPHLHRVRSDG